VLAQALRQPLLHSTDACEVEGCRHLHHLGLEQIAHGLGVPHPPMAWEEPASCQLGADVIFGRDAKIGMEQPPSPMAHMANSSRTISTVYFYDPDVNQYFAIPYRHTAHPPISVWERREARRRLKAEGHQGVNEDLIFDAYNRLRALEDEAIRDTRTARRSAQQRRVHSQMARLTLSPSRPPIDGPVDDLDDIQPFDEIEELNG
jgi:hypothetical protein